MKIVEILKAKCQLQSHKQRTIAKALQCKGWTSERKLSLLYDLAQRIKKIDGDILEIGSAWGRSTVLLALATNKQVWSIDPHTGGIAYIRRGEDQDSFEEFQENLKKNKIQCRVNILRNTTAETEKNGTIPQRAIFSMVFIDGLHTSEGVSIDFSFAYNRLVDSGIIVFDDYFEPTLLDYRVTIDNLTGNKGIKLEIDDTARLVYIIK